MTAAEKAIFGYLTGIPGEMQVINAVSSTGYTIVPITTAINIGHTDIMAIPTNDLLKAICSYEDKPAVKMRRIDAKYASNCPTADNYKQSYVKILLETGKGTWGTYTEEEPLYIAYVFNKENKEITKKNVLIAMKEGRKRAKKKASNEEEEIELLSYYAYQEMINLYRKNEAALTTGFILWELKGLQNTYQEMKAEQDKGTKNDLRVLSHGNVLISSKRYLSKYGAVIYRYNEHGWTTETIGANNLQRPPAKPYDYIQLCEIDHYRKWWQEVTSKSDYDYIRYMRQDEHDEKAEIAGSKYFRKSPALWWKIMNGDVKAAKELFEKINKPIYEELQKKVNVFKEKNKEMLTEYKRLLSELDIPQEKITIGQMREAREQAKRNIEAKKANKE